MSYQDMQNLDPSDGESWTIVLFMLWLLGSAIYACLAGG